MPDPLTALSLAAGLSAAALAVLARVARRLPQALPSTRSLHDRPVPRVGGLAIWAGALPVALLSPPALSGHALAWVAAWLAVAAVSLEDDRRHVPVAVRLSVHGIASLALALAIAGADPGWRVAALALAIAWSMNLFNFMDGSDGLAAAMATTGFGAFSAALAMRGEPWVACAAIPVGAIAFLAVNRPPASMFMGDVGSVPLGMLAAAAGADGVARGTWPWWFPVLAFLPFVLDASVTLARRALRGERLSQAHRSHYYQRLLQLGAGHRGTLAVYGALMAACALAALACLASAPSAGPYVLATFVLAHAVLFATIDYHWGRQADTR